MSEVNRLRHELSELMRDQENLRLEVIRLRHEWNEIRKDPVSKGAQATSAGELLKSM